MNKINNSYVDEEGKEPVLLDPFDPKKVSIATRPLTWTNIITRMRKKTITFFLHSVTTAYLGGFFVTDPPLRSQLGTKIRICGKPNRLWSIANARLLCL